jgi:acyl-CoA hydrolase
VSTQRSPQRIPDAKRVTPAEAAAALRPSDVLGLPLGTGQPPALLRALGERGDWQDLWVFSALLLGLYPLFTHPNVHMRSGFFGPVERGLQEAGHDVAFVPADFRRFARILEDLRPRVVATAAAPPDAEGFMSLSLHAGATVEDLRRAGRDPERLLIVEVNPRLPRTLGLPPEAPHAIHVDEADLILEAESPLPVLPEPRSTDVERTIAKHAVRFIASGSTLQTGIGGIPSQVAALLADGPGGDYGVHSEMFTTGLMQLHQAGKVTNRRKGIYEGFSVCTFAAGNEALYAWLDANEAVRFLPVETVNAPEVIARNENMVCINGALAMDLHGQVASDALGATQHSGIGGAEDFAAGPGLDASDRSLLCVPSTASPGGRRVSRIVEFFEPGTPVTTPRHQADVVITEYGVAELAGRSVAERARALAEIAHPDFRDALLRAAAQR